MNKKKLGVSVGVVSLMTLAAVGIGKSDVLTDVLKNTPDSYVESISTYEEKEVEKLLNTDKDVTNELEKLENIKLNKSQMKESSKSILAYTKPVSISNYTNYASASSVSSSSKQTTTEAPKAQVEEVKETSAPTEPVVEESKEEPELRTSNAELVSLSGWVSNDLNLREEAKASAPVLATIPKGTKVSGIENNGWVEVDYNGEEGFVSKQYISTQEIKVEEPKVEEPKEEAKPENKPSTSSVTGWVSTNLNLRSEANPSSSILATIQKGTKVSGSESNGWVKVEYSGKTGYIAKSYVSNTEIKVEETKPENKPSTSSVTGWVSTNLNLRSKANSSSSILATIPKGTKVSGSESNGWVKVTYNGKTGYIAKSYVSNTEVKPNTDNGSSNNQGGNTANSSTVNKIVNDANNYIGYRYVYGAASPNVGFDCSGLVYYLYKTHAGITLNRNSAAQASNGYQVSFSNIKPGDLLFYAMAGGSRISHVGIYVGNGQMVHASTPKDGVIKTDINSNYYTSRFVTARRIIN